MRFFLVFILLFPFYVNAQADLQPIGSWRAHLPHISTIDVTASPTKIYAATPFSLYRVDIPTNEVERFSKVSGLSETGISTIKYDAVNDKLFVAYTNSNIDIITSNKIINVPDLKRENIAGDKTIYHFYPDNNFCYMSTGLGVIVLDAVKNEIKDSWFIGNNGGYVKTNMFSKDNNFFYAATEEGLKRTPVTTANPADFQAWQNLSGNNGLPATASKGVINNQNKIIALANDSLFVYNGNAWTLFFTNGWPIISINASENKIVVCQQMTNGASRVVILNADGFVEKTLANSEVISFPKKGIIHNNIIWIADQYKGLSRWSGNNFYQYTLNSPEDIASGEMIFYNNKFFATAGAVNSAWNYQYNRAGIYQFSDGTWTNYNGLRFQQLDTLLDIITVAIDPRDETIWAGSYGGGLLHIKENQQFDIYKQNSPISFTIGDPSGYRVSGLVFDADNNLWISNFGASKYLHVLKNDGSWQSYTSPFSLFGNAVSQILVDDANQKWIVAPLGNGLIAFDHNNTIDNLNDDKWRLFKTGAGNGGLPSNNVFTIAKDKSGFIWVGTDNGIGVIQCPQDVFINGCEAILPIIKQGNFNNYLFKGEEVRSIAVDGADRKWVATKNGVWLINADGDKVLAHFTEINSPLLSNDVKRIAINGNNGEVFFATAKGIVSFRGTATETVETMEKINIFPNPVPPGYGGTIAIRGLVENSFIKITELNGRLVYQSRALGGQAIWNGKDNAGKQVATGVYLVIITDEQKIEKAAGKIVFIGR